MIIEWALPLDDTQAHLNIGHVIESKLFFTNETLCWLIAWTMDFALGRITVFADIVNGF